MAPESWEHDLFIIFFMHLFSKHSASSVLLVFNIHSRPLYWEHLRIQTISYPKIGSRMTLLKIKRFHWACAQRSLRFPFSPYGRRTRHVVVVHPPQGLTCFAFRDAFLLMWVTMSSYHFGHSLSLNPFHPQNCCSLDGFCLSHHSM